MHKKFDSSAIEKKWQGKWKETGLYNVGEREVGKEKEYVLVEWPYPSGNLHIGHWYAFAVPDIYVRFQRMMGKQVMYPMGFDAFGLPAENAAIKRNISPREWTEANIEFMKGQLASMGNAFTWNKTTSSTDPEYYKWTQAMFGQFFDKGIAYRGKGIVNWCPGCNTVIANEQVLTDGTCERSGDVIEKREMPQWMLKITDYADRLIDDLDALDWPEHIKEAQRQWIGRSKGAEIDFELYFTHQPEANDNRGPHGEKAAIKIFTTRPDTLFGATYMVLAPEHLWVTLATDDNHHVLENKEEVLAYIEEAKQKDDIERGDATREKSGVELKGVKAINPATGEQIPVYVADYVLGGYGTGAIMAVPAHDERDFVFAKKFNLPIQQVVNPSTNFSFDASCAVLRTTTGSFLFQRRTQDAPRNPGGVSMFSGGKEREETPLECIQRELVEELGEGIKKYLPQLYFVAYKDSPTIPDVTRSIFFIDGVDKTQLTVLEGDGFVEVSTMEELEGAGGSIYLTEVLEKVIKGYLLTTPGVLTNSGEFDGMDSEEAKEAIVKKVGGRMTNTYRLRDWSIGRQRYWGVPIPIVYDPEGKAHAIPAQHLPWLLPEDVDFTPTGEAPLAKSEVLKKRTEEIFGVGWTPEVETMDTFVDSSWYFLRYLDNKNETALSSLEQQKQWMPVDLYFGGAEHTTMHLLYSRFWQKALFDLGLVTETEPYKRRVNRGLILGPDGNKMSKSKGNVIDPDEQVARVGSDTVKMYLAFMGPYEGNNYPWDMGGIAGLRRFLERVYGLVDAAVEQEPESVTRQLHKTIKKVGEDIAEFKFNTAISAMMIFVNMAEKEGVSKASLSAFVKVLAPFAPHITEEAWQELGNQESVHLEVFPVADTALTVDSEVTIAVQLNGKMRGTITLSATATEAEAVATAKVTDGVAERLKDVTITKVIYVPGKILNLVHNP